MGGIYSATDRVCWFGNCTNYYPSEGEPPSAEDARLLTASPDLLAALIAAEAKLRDYEIKIDLEWGLGELTGDSPLADFGDQVQQANAAIAKATTP